MKDKSTIKTNSKRGVKKMNKILENISEYITDFERVELINFDIDTMRIQFDKQRKLPKLKTIGKWEKLESTSYILYKLKERLFDTKVTSAYKLEGYDIYYYNLSDPPKYRKAMMVIFGLAQYHRTAPPTRIIHKILDTLKNVSDLDICYDTSIKPNIKKIESFYDVHQFIDKFGVFTQTHYINNTSVVMLDKITIYDKAFKNNLGFKVWRYEARINIPNIKYLALPLNEFKDFINITEEN